MESLNEASKEYVVWGIPPNKKDEEILFTKAKTHKEAKNVCSTLEKEHKCKKCRVQIIDFKNKPDFVKTLRKSIREMLK